MLCYKLWLFYIMFLQRTLISYRHAVRLPRHFSFLKNNRFDDTIYAISSGTATKSGVAVIRASGMLDYVSKLKKFLLSTGLRAVSKAVSREPTSR